MPGWVWVLIGIGIGVFAAIVVGAIWLMNNGPFKNM